MLVKLKTQHGADVYVNSALVLCLTENAPCGTVLIEMIPSEFSLSVQGTIGEVAEKLNEAPHA